MLKVKDLSKSYGPLTVLSDVSFGLEGGQRAALVGPNGTGKSTLLKILAGLEEADGGKVEMGKSDRAGYLPQDTSLAGSETIHAYLRRVTEIDRVEAEMDDLSDSLSDPTSKRRYDELHELYEQMDGYSFEHRLEVMLGGFGLEGVGSSRPLSELSSGQKSKVVLIGILLGGADLLLLDEPTNNLDLPALIWLEDFLLKSPAACVLVSHDRRFLDKVADRIMELDWQSHSLTVTNGSYSEYLRMSAKRRERQKELYRQQQEQIERLTEQARRLKQRSAQGSRWVGSDNDKFLRGMKRDRAGKSGKGAKAIEKRIEQMEPVERPLDRVPFGLDLDSQEEKGPDREIRLEKVVAGYPTGFRIGPISLAIPYGERVGIMGLNGTGKSTLLKVIAGHCEPLSGKVVFGSGVRLGDMMQEHDSLPRETELLGYLKQKVGISDQDAYTLLAKYGFDPGRARVPISALSPGGRARLLLSLFAAMGVNALVLDEPTNHLDLEAMEALEEALEDYPGTVILVSHDRFFLDKARLDLTYLLTKNQLKKIPSYQVYVAQAEEQAQRLLRTLRS